MILRRFIQHIKEQNWFAVGLDVVVVIVGIFLGMQVTEWNENRNERTEERVVLQRLQLDLKLDLEQMEIQLATRNEYLADYIYCLDVLAGKVDATKEEFSKRFRSVLMIGYMKQNMTTFNDLQTSGQFTLIQEQEISDAIVEYYHTEIEGWVSADREYTRNIIAPYLLEYDYAPTSYTKGFSDDLLAIRANISQYSKPERSLEEYKNNYFIINILRTKIYALEGQVSYLNELIKEAEVLNLLIDEYLGVNI